MGKKKEFIVIVILSFILVFIIAIGYKKDQRTFIHDENTIVDTPKDETPDNKPQENEEDEIDVDDESQDEQENETLESDESDRDETDAQEEAHKHIWEEVKRQVKHKEKGHYEKVLVKEAYDEEVIEDVFEEHAVCDKCGIDFGKGDEAVEKAAEHINGSEECESYHIESIKVGEETVTKHHDAVYEDKWIVDKEAWTEEVVDHYECKECGKTKK